MPASVLIALSTFWPRAVRMTSGRNSFTAAKMFNAIKLGIKKREREFVDSSIQKNNEPSALELELFPSTILPSPVWSR